MEDDDNQDVFVDLKNFNCKRCGQFPQELTIYTCQNLINRKECGFNYSMLMISQEQIGCANTMKAYILFADKDGNYYFHLIPSQHHFYVYLSYAAKIFPYRLHKNHKIYKHILLHYKK